MSMNKEVVGRRKNSPPSRNPKYVVQVSRLKYHRLVHNCWSRLKYSEPERRFCNREKIHHVLVGVWTNEFLDMNF